MRRLKILFFWIFFKKNNVTFNELIKFLTKPKVNVIAKKYIKSITNADDFLIEFNVTSKILFWPKTFSIDRLDQVVAETFDIDDWHFYQKEHTVIEEGEILLDIGTAEGLFPLTVIDKCKHIYLIEPSKTFSDCLQKTFNEYPEKVTLHNVAVGNQDGRIYFNEASLDGSVTSEQSSKNNEIAIHKIDTLIGNNRITYLKADIEGFEQEMLKGALQTITNNKPKIAITTYHTANNPEDIIALIKSYVPEYKYYVKGIYEKTPKPVLIHFWI